MNALAILLLTLTAFQPAPSEGRTQVRLLYSFEAPAELDDLRRFAENVDFDVVQDNGITEGKVCCQLTAKRGSSYSVFQLGPKTVKDWKDFDYFALDLYTDDEHEYALNFELWDGLSKNYATRYTQSLRTHKGRQTLLFPINRAKRNGKEGREWDELLPQDKIDLNGLTRVKLFLTPLKERDTVFWIDNLRLMQEDAARPKMKVPLPAEAIAFDFGSPGTVVPGFKNVSAATVYSDKLGFGFVDKAKRTHAGEGWPDLLTGTYVTAPPGQRLKFQARVPDGEYHAWLAAGPIIRADLQSPHYYLTLGGQRLADDQPGLKDLASPKYLYRFLDTLYSEKPHALWHNYISKMYPAHVQRVEVRSGLLTVEAECHFLGALILLPVAKSEEFVQLQQTMRTARIQTFEQSYYAPPRPRVKPEPADAAFVVWQPQPLRQVLPWSSPSKEERQLGLKAVAVPGQRLVFRVAFTPYKERGPCWLDVGELRGDRGKLPAKLTRGYLQNYRSNGKDVSEMALLPQLTVESEPNLTWCFWLWQEVPSDAQAGTYRGQHVFRTRHGEAVKVPVEVEVLPLKLKRDLPLSLGMYFNEPHLPAPPAEQRRAHLVDLLSWMRTIGFTGVATRPPTVLGLNRDGTVKLQFDSLLHEVAREVGMGRRQEQYSTGSVLGLGRAIGRRLPGSQGAKVDQQPGIELRQPEFGDYFLNGLEQYRDFLEKSKLPVAVEIVDEPREAPNPWNRNLADTITYAKYVGAVQGLKGFITPMGDSNGGKDYTMLADYPAILSVHGWKASAGLMKRAREKKTTLWLYNTGMDRFSWGFYNWKVGSKGRWEWHFSWPEDNAVGGYPGREWYNPFTAIHGLASQAPWPQYRGGILFQSAYLQVSEGITDAIYLHTLEEAIREQKAAGKTSEALPRAEAFVAELRRVIPEFPEVKGLKGDGSGALVGEGINDLTAARAGEWRGRIAQLLKELR